MYRISRHRNGLVVASAEMPHMASVSVGLWVGVGGRFEPSPISGISHFIEHLLFKGTRTRTAKEISQDIEGVGGYLNAFTSEENTCFYSKACYHRFPELLEVLMDMFLNSTFASTEIDKERSVIKEELAMYIDQPQHHVHDLLNETMWPDQPLGRPLTGTEKTLDAIQREELLAFKRANYVCNATVVSVAGNLDHEHVVKAVSKFARLFPTGKRPQFTPVRVEQREPRTRLFTKAIEQTQLALGFRACSRHDERRFALRLLNTLVGENMSSHLFQVIREDHGLAYSIASGLGFFEDTGLITISAGLDTDNLSQLLKLVVRELKTFTKRAPSPAELARARDYVIGQVDLGLENTENQMMWLGEHFLGHGKIIAPSEVKDKIRLVTPAQVRQAAHDFFRPENLSMALVSPLKSADSLKSLLRF